MIRLALPKGRALGPVLTALRAAGLELPGLASGDGGDRGETERRLRIAFPADGVEVLLLKGWDLPLYVEHGVADCGVVGSDVLDELGCNLLVPLRLADGVCRLSLIGRGPEALPPAGGQARLATKYPLTARRLVARRPWGAEVVRLAGSIELAPLLGLAELGLDIVQTGRTLADNDLVELETVAEVRPCVVVNRAALQARRATLNGWIDRLEAAGVVR